MEDGYTVYAAARRLDRMRSLEELGARVLQMDVTSEEDVRMVMDRIKAEQGGIDVLVNNAGFGIDVVVIEPGGVRTEFGDVAFGPAVERSADGAYGEQILPMMEKFRGMMERSEGSSRPMGSPPSVIAGTISRALKARRPKTRYVTGYGARMFLFLRRWTSDRIYDRIMRRFAG